MLYKQVGHKFVKPILNSYKTLKQAHVLSKSSVLLFFQVNIILK